MEKDILREAVVFLLSEYIEQTGVKYVGFVNHIGDLKNNRVLAGVLRKERDNLGGKLSRAKAYLEALKSD